MKFLGTFILLLSLMIARPASSQYIQISNIQWPQLSYTKCTQSDIFVNLIRSCYNSSFTSYTHSVSGSNLYVNIYYSVTGTCNSTMDFPGFQLSLGLLPARTYAVTVKVYLNTVLQATGTSSLTVNVGTCCPFDADAGNDTSYCDMDSIQLKGNSPPSYSKGKWTVISGGGTIATDSLANAWAANLSYGTNAFRWTTTDSVCTTKDSVVIFNSEPPTDATTEIDKVACYDTVSIYANPLTVGTGKWTPITIGPTITNKSKNLALASNLNLGLNKFIWTTSNQTCPDKKDTLRVEYYVVTHAPLISVAGLVLTSDVQPWYQWYNGQNAIPGATNQSYTVTANGFYKVYAAGKNCPNGLFSNEVEIKTVGLEQYTTSDIKVYPNPSAGFIYIEPTKPNSVVRVLDQLGRVVYEEKVLADRTKCDVSHLKSGMYQVMLIQDDETLVREILIK